MSLLPEFNEKFKELCESKSGLPFSAKALTELSFRNASDLLNPNLNPLTFEEVKAWFDQKAEESECVYHGEHKPGWFWYEFYLRRNFILSEAGYKKYRNSPEISPYSSLLKELSDNPLYTFCQMKGYVNI